MLDVIIVTDGIYKKYNKNMYVSVVIPIYKTPIDWLIMCIKSVINQTHKDIQLILVDDFSNSSEIDIICNDYCKKDSRVEYYKLEENKGISHALNFNSNKDDFFLKKKSLLK